MTDHDVALYVLLVEDDKENLHLLLKTLPESILGYKLEWDPCDSFEEAIKRIKVHRYDMIVTDIYLDRPEKGDKGKYPEDAKAMNIVKEIRETRFCPIIVFSSASPPEKLASEPFIKYADKTAPGDKDLINKLSELISTGIPGIARRLHDDLDRASGSYLWDFLEGNWEQLRENGLKNPSVLERLVRRRAALQIGRLNPESNDPSEVKIVEGVEYYIHPPVSDDMRLGEILKRKSDGSFRVILTPHCYLETQSNSEEPRAEYILLANTVPANEMLNMYPPQGKTKHKKLKSLSKMMQSPARDNRLKPEGRYWFLPGFLDMPDLYIDLLQIESIPYRDVLAQFERHSVLDTPFAEALQSSYAKFISTVGVPVLNSGNFEHLIMDKGGG